MTCKSECQPRNADKALTDYRTYQQYVYGIRNRLAIPGAHIRLTGSKFKLFSLNLLIMSPRPCHVIISTKAYDMKLVMLVSALDDCILARGWGKACVGDQGILLVALAHPVAGSHLIYSREHKVQGNTQLLSAMYMSKTRWICNDCVGHEGFR